MTPAPLLTRRHLLGLFLSVSACAAPAWAADEAPDAFVRRFTGEMVELVRKRGGQPLHAPALSEVPDLDPAFIVHVRKKLDLGQREAELITVATNTGLITIDRRLVPSHYLYDLNMGYRRKIGRYNTNVQVNLSNLADDDKFYGAVWQTGRTYRLSAGVSF